MTQLATCAFALTLVACGGQLTACGAREGHVAPSKSIAAQEAPPPEGADEPPLPLPPGTEVSFEKELRLVEKVRELRAAEPVRGFRIAEDDLLSHLERSVAREVPQHALVGTEEMLRLLGVVPEHFDYEKTVLGLLREQLAGLYDPRQNAMFVRDHLEGAELDATLYHELVHALQDQAYHLDDFSQWKPDGTDRSSALSALAEGDATSAMYDALYAVLAERTDTPRRTALDLSNAELLVGLDAAADAVGDDGVPPIVRRSLLAPYRDGLLFVQTLRRRGGWAQVNAAFESPPASTEQILHPERYFAREAPIALPVLAPPGEGFEKTLSDVWGEQSVRLLFEEWMTRQEAAAAAVGWGGDRIAVFARGAERVLTWNLIFDDASAAKRHFLAFARERLTADSFCRERARLGPLAVAVEGPRLVVLAGPRAQSTPQAAGCASALAWTARALKP